MSELENQVDEPITDVEQVEQAEQPEEQPEASELATDSESQHEQNAERGEETPINQDKVNAAINKQHRLRKEAEERERKMREQLEQLKAYQQPQRPALPPEPDPFSDTFEQEKKAYKEALQSQAVWDAQQNILMQQQQQRLIEQQQKQEQEIRSKTESYVGKAKDVGITPEELAQHGTVASQYFGVDMQLAIISDPDGALLTKYFAQNPMEAMQVGQMSPWDAANYVNNNVRAKAKRLTPKTSSAPPPASKVESSGAKVETSDPLLEGGSFE